MQHLRRIVRFLVSNNNNNNNNNNLFISCKIALKYDLMCIIFGKNVSFVSRILVLTPVMGILLKRQLS